CGTLVFFLEEDGIRDRNVTGVQTCALPISAPVEGNGSISQNPSGKYFVSLCCTDVEIDPLPSTGAVVGLDMGLKSFAITSDGVEDRKSVVEGNGGGLGV